MIKIPTSALLFIVVSFASFTGNNIFLYANHFTVTTSLLDSNVHPCGIDKNFGDYCFIANKILENSVDTNELTKEEHFECFVWSKFYMNFTFNNDDDSYSFTFGFSSTSNFVYIEDSRDLSLKLYEDKNSYYYNRLYFLLVH